MTALVGTTCFKASPCGDALEAKVTTYRLEGVLVHTLVAKGFEICPVEGRFARSGAAAEQNDIDFVRFGESSRLCSIPVSDHTLNTENHA